VATDKEISIYRVPWLGCTHCVQTLCCDKAISSLCLPLMLFSLHCACMLQGNLQYFLPQLYHTITGL